MMDEMLYEDDPELVRERLRRMLPGDWYVFEAFSADGSLAIGVARGTPDPSLVLVIYEGLSEAAAKAAANGLTRWKHSQGRNSADF
jgi:hypothetical protein